MPEGSYLKRKCIKELYITEFKTRDNQVIILEHFKSLWLSGKEFENSFRETL